MTRGNHTNRHLAARLSDTKQNKGAVSIYPHGSKSTALVIVFFHCGVRKLSGLTARYLYLMVSYLADSTSHQSPLLAYSVEKLPDGAFSIISGGRQTINLATRVAYTRFWRVGFLCRPATRHGNRVFQQNRLKSGHSFNGLPSLLRASP